MKDVRLTRRSAIRLTAAAAATAALGRGGGLLAAPPTTGKTEVDPAAPWLRAGPLGLNPAPVLGGPVIRPAAIWVDKAGIDAPIETAQIVDGVMQNPTGPWVVAWYEQTAAIGEFGNVVMAGHVDYWDVGPAVFWYLKELVPGDRIVVVGDDGRDFTYAMEWSQNYEVASLTPETIDEIVGRTKRECLTLITCGGPFDYATGEYLERFVVRAERVAS